MDKQIKHLSIDPIVSKNGGPREKGIFITWTQGQIGDYIKLKPEAHRRLLAEIEAAVEKAIGKEEE